VSWAGRDQLLAEFLPRFHNRQIAIDSLTEYVKTARLLDDERARTWLEQDLLRDQELAAIEQMSADAAAPRPSLYALGSCYHCYGRGMVRLDIDLGHADFGKAKPCPACSTTTRDPAEHCDNCRAFSAQNSSPSTERNRCWKCGQFEDQPAAEKCSNPRWHLPNVNLPALHAPDGWKHIA